MGSTHNPTQMKLNPCTSPLRWDRIGNTFAPAWRPLKCSLLWLCSKMQFLWTCLLLPVLRGTSFQTNLLQPKSLEQSKKIRVNPWSARCVLAKLMMRALTVRLRMLHSVRVSVMHDFITGVYACLKTATPRCPHLRSPFSAPGVQCPSSRLSSLMPWKIFSSWKNTFIHSEKLVALQQVSSQPTPLPASTNAWAST